MPHSQMVINYVPGDECRVAIVEDGKLEELYAERFSAASRVGNIYVGRVMNVEPSIQAAFIDFGVDENGFLHYSDLHPRYFPGEDVEETTERVGHKTPRRERPPIQHCLRRGDEVTVQVLKEGVGTKGPTLTSYLSIPGRFLVMMPQMDKVGVSRKVEDEEQRRQMREILDQLELPDGFGFILRTAGLDRTKLELKRDLAYLLRLWKDMEKRLTSGSKARLLYSESDLLVRCLRDQLTADINEVIIDHELALQRAARFMKIVSPRSQTKLLHYPGKTPVFHGFGIEKQIATIHAREVPLPGGGRLVIDQTEALVAIDVNSGKMRDSKDAETNAYKTNVEAVDEICRQLRLRDLGGIVVNDLIDMRHASHRKDIENRFKERLKRDKARTTTASISAFGILEMTRQRMRGSHESVHFVDCPTCRGRGLVQRPDSVAADGLRELAAILDLERVSKVELVVAPRVAGELLSGKRQLLGRIERSQGKHVDVRVSETVPIDRVSFYAYDAAGADIDVTNLPETHRAQDLKEWDIGPAGPEDSEAWAADTHAEIAAASQEPEVVEEVVPPSEHPIEFDGALDGAGPQAPGGDEQEQGGRRRRRRRRGRGGRAPQEGRGPAAPHSAPQHAQGDAPTLVGEGSGAPQPVGEIADNGAGPHSATPPPPPGSPPGSQPGTGAEGTGRRRRRRRRRGRGGAGGDGAGGAGEPRQAGEPIDNQPHNGPVDQPAVGNGPGAGGPPRQSGYRNVLRGDHGEPDDLEPAAPTGAEPAPDLGDGAPAGAPGEDGGAPGGGRRRRRRRRGRGGGGGRPEQSGGPQGGGGQGGGGQRPPAPPPPQDRPPPQQGRSAPPPAAHNRPIPAPVPPAPVGAPKPKLLYVSRRRLLPSELAKRPKPE